MPANVTSVTVEAWGGGGGRASRGGGGAGGQYARKVVSVTPGLGYTITVGGGGTGATSSVAAVAGGDSIFSRSTTNFVLAKGGSAGSNGNSGAGGSGSVANGVGDVISRGGNGSAGVSGNGGYSGAGGGGAGSSGDGGDASGATAGGGTSTGGGDGGAGRSSNGNGNAGTAWGGGGGGAYGNNNGGAGAAGRVVLTWAGAPSATTDPASSVLPDSAALNGTVSSNDGATTVTFEYGTTTAYGSTVTAAESPLPAGASGTAVAASVSGLVPNTTYNFRVKAANATASVNGANRTFKTPVPAVLSINLASNNPTTANVSVSWTVTFNAAVTGVDAGDFVLIQSGGASGAAITGVVGSGTTWTVTANSGTSAQGKLGLNLVDDDSIVVSGVPLGGAGKGNGNFSGQLYTLATPWPTLAKEVSAASAVIGDVVVFTITASNAFAVPLSDVVISDMLPAGMAHQATVATLGSVSVAGQSVVWTIPTLPALGSAQLSLAVSLSQQGALTNTVTSPGATSASAKILVLAKAVTHYKFDAKPGDWNGTANEVTDSGGTGLHGRRLTTTSPTATNEVTPNPTIASQYSSVVGGFCNAASFDGRGVVTVGSSKDFGYTTTLSASAWIYPTATNTGGDKLASILSNDTNYEFHLDGDRKLYWWWSASTLTSNTQIPLNQWTHVAITMDSSQSGGRQRIYINGVQDSASNNWKGSLTANACPFYIGGDISTGSSCSLLPERNFRGMIDEVKLYNFELSADEVQADMTLGRLCSGSFNHIRIEHDGVGSVCSPKSVTVKACFDANCSTLYPGTVTVSLSPSGWIGAGGDKKTFSGGIASFQLSNGSAGDVTLGTSSVEPAPSGDTRCFKNGSESCTLNFANASCAFDAAEKDGSPQSRIYTKLVGTAFDLDVLALSANSAINANYSGTVAVDLVDTSSAVCPTGSGLTTATNVTFNKQGRRSVSFNYPNAARNVKVRARVGSSAPACSSDNFAIRPKQLSVSSSMSNASLAGEPKAVAGAPFTLTAAAGVTSGYDGKPALDASKVKDHNNAQIAAGTLSGSFDSGTGSEASGAGFKYLDVGAILLDPDAAVDSGFTAVDQPDDCVTNSTSNSLTNGKYGCNIGSASSGPFGRWTPSHFSFAGTLSAGCAAGNFTYMGEDSLGVNLAVTAHAWTGAAATASDPVVSRYTSGYTGLASVTLSGDNNGTVVATTRLTSPDFPTMPSTANWSVGRFTINDIYAFARPAAPDGPFESYRLVASLSDPDGASLIGSAAQKATNTTRIRYGRLQFGNAYGSELLPLPIPVEAQFWQTGGFYVTNRDDSCTTFNVSSVALSNPTQNLALCETWFSPTTAVTLAGGRSSLRLTAPGAGNSGSINLALNVGNAAAGLTCLSNTPANATASNLPQFGATNPGGRATFGVRKAPLIYRRENY